MSRYPYTYAADYLRIAAMEPNDFGDVCNVSRYQASSIISATAKDLGMERHELAKILADQYAKDNPEYSLENGEAGS
jgi:hypothetical protein